MTTFSPPCIVSPLRATSSTRVAAEAAYPPDAIPGARDITTPYGSMRVYEWGPTDGKKVVFVHGDATPAPMFANIAQHLVDQGGLRVMLFDTPLDVRHDARLFAQQISFAIATPPLSDWTGERAKGFALVGFSLGWPIALTFAAAFSQHVSSLVLLGPAGLIRRLPVEYENRALTHPVETQTNAIQRREAVRVALGVSLSPAPTAPAASSGEQARSALLNNPTRVTQDFNMSALFQWQFDFHAGHAFSFAETVRYGPLQEQHALYSYTGQIVRGESRVTSSLRKQKIPVFFGKEDSVVVPSETTEDLLKLIGTEYLDIRTVPGGHGFPYPNSEVIAKTMLRFWGPIEDAKGSLTL